MRRKRRMSHWLRKWRRADKKLLPGAEAQLWPITPSSEEKQRQPGWYTMRS
jgi:hypothetical protein